MKAAGNSITQSAENRQTLQLSENLLKWILFAIIEPFRDSI
jgi:hypothetical protein